MTGFVATTSSGLNVLTPLATTVVANALSPFAVLDGVQGVVRVSSPGAVAGGGFAYLVQIQFPMAVPGNPFPASCNHPDVLVDVSYIYAGCAAFTASLALALATDGAAQVACSSAATTAMSESVTLAFDAPFCTPPVGF